MTSRASSVVSPSTIVDRAAAPAVGLRLLTVLFAATATAAASQVSVPLPFTPVPFTLQPVVVLMAGVVLGARLGASSQALYLALGLAGLPVFAFAPDLPQGLLRLLGPSGGYLMAYPLAAFVAGAVASRGRAWSFRTMLAALGSGLAVIYAGGVSWLAAQLGAEAALALGLLPFLFADVLKIVGAAAGIRAVATAWMK